MAITLEDFKSMVPDEGMRKYLTYGVIDEDSWFNDTSSYVNVYQNMVSLAFIYAFSCYLDLKNNLDSKEARLESCIREGNSNSQRVIRTMDNIYKKYPLTQELMQFVLADIHYDFIQGESACLQSFFPYCVSSSDYWNDKKVSLNDYFSFLSENAKSSRDPEKFPTGDNWDHDTAERYFKLLLGFFPFISRTGLRFDEKAQWYIFEIRDYTGEKYRGGIIDTFGLVRKFLAYGRNFFFLSSIEEDTLTYESPNLNDYITCSMSGVGDEPAYSKHEIGVIKTVEVDDLGKIYKIPTDYETIMSYFDSDMLDVENEPMIDATVGQLFNINYKYMKNLALSIADVIGKEHNKNAVKRLKEVFGKQYPLAFESFDEEKSNLDNMVVLLLMEVGASMVLREVFYELNDGGDADIVRNLNRRFGAFIKEAFNDIKTGKDFAKRAKELLGSKYIEDARSEKIKNYNRELLAKAKTQIVLSALIEAEKNSEADSDIDCFHTDTIQQYIILLKAIEDSCDSKGQCETVNKLLGDTFKRLICFYHGIFAYGAEKIKFDSEAQRKVLSTLEIKKYQKDAESKFLKDAAQKAEELDGKDTISLIREFVELCEKCYKSEISGQQTRSDESKRLYAVLGKNSIMNTKSFKRIIDTDKIQSIDDAKWWVSAAIKVLQFLSFGALKNEKGAPRLFSAIAPMVASYNNHSDSMDGYDTASFALIFDANEIGGDTMEIKMLSEFSYEISKRYYCLPNIVRSNNKWWIDPFVIKCQDFDKIFF